MPPALALSIGLAFAAWLLYQDVKFRRPVSTALWIPLCAVCVLASRPLSAWLEPGVAVRYGANGNVEGHPIDQLYYVALLLASGIVAVSRRLKWSRLVAANLALIAMYAYFALSVLWSDNPTGSFTRWVKDVGLLVVISILNSESNRRDAIRVLYFRAACIILPLSIIVIRYYPEIGRGYHVTGAMLLTGLSETKNGLGQSVMILCLFLAWDFTQRIKSRARSLNILLILMGAWLLYISDSQTALACTLLGLGLILSPHWLASSKLLNSLLLAVVLFLIVVLPLQSRLTWLLAPVVEALGRDMTFTGRDEAWRAILNYPVDPIFGAGFSNFWGTRAALEIRHSLQTPVITAHNSYLDIYLDGGLIGVALLLTTLITRLLLLIKNSCAANYGRMRFAVLIVVMVYGLTETVLARPCILWFTALLLLMEYPVSTTWDESQPRLRGVLAPQLAARGGGLLIRR